jgi:hypothetical protein
MIAMITPTTVERPLSTSNEPGWLNSLDSTTSAQLRGEAWRLFDQCLADEAQESDPCTAPVGQLQTEAWRLLDQCLADERQTQQAECQTY